MINGNITNLDKRIGGYMSLKQECIDMINLIVEPLKRNDYDVYDVEVDSIRDICELTGEDITYLDCSDCEHKENCIYNKRVNVDVSFWDYSDIQRNYIFTRKSPVEKGVTCIWNRKQLMFEMSKLKREMEEYKDWCANFGERYQDYMEYAKEFSEKLQKDFSYMLDDMECSIFGMLNIDVLPIVFHTDYRKDIDWNSRTYTTGDFYVYGQQSIINIYCSMDKEEEVKSRIRHELIHYFLYMAGLKHKDDTAIFHTLCRIYDAGAYMDMSEDEQKLYDMFEVALDKLNNLLKNNDITEDFHNLNVAVMLYAVGDKKQNSETYEHGMKLLAVLNRKMEDIA